MRIKCDECGGKIVKKKVDYSVFGVSLGKFPAEVCAKCNETCFDDLPDPAGVNRPEWDRLRIFLRLGLHSGH